MSKVITFYGASGNGYGFDEVRPQDAWATQAGVAVFAAPDAYGWRVIQIVELTGRDHDVRPIWAYYDAERYGASAVFLTRTLDKEQRKIMIRDLEAGLSPVIGQQHFALAA